MYRAGTQANANTKENVCPLQRQRNANGVERKRNGNFYQNANVLIKSPPWNKVAFPGYSSLQLSARAGVHATNSVLFPSGRRGKIHVSCETGEHVATLFPRSSSLCAPAIVLGVDLLISNTSQCNFLNT